MKPKMKGPISYYGGKQSLLNHLIPLIPKHKIYIEPYFWWGALFWAKEPAECEVINDLNMNVVNFYQVLQTRFEELYKRLEVTLHSRETYRKALIIYDSPRLFADSPITRSRAFFVCTNMWYTFKIGSRGYDKTKKSSTAFKNKINNFQNAMSERLRHTQIEQNPAHKVIQSRDSEDAFIYADPPYINTNQWHYGWYTEEHFIRDLDVLATIKGKFLLSNYPSEILTEYINKYNRYTKTIDRPLTAWHRLKSSQGRRKKEMLVANYPI